MGTDIEFDPQYVRENKLKELWMRPSAFTNTFAYNFLHAPAQRYGYEIAHNNSSILKILGASHQDRTLDHLRRRYSRYSALTDSSNSHS